MVCENVLPEISGTRVVDLARMFIGALVVRTLGLKGGLLVARLLNRFTKAFSVVVSTLVELLTDGIGDLGGARGVGVVNGL